MMHFSLTFHCSCEFLSTFRFHLLSFNFRYFLFSVSFFSSSMVQVFYLFLPNLSAISPWTFHNFDFIPVFHTVGRQSCLDDNMTNVWLTVVADVWRKWGRCGCGLWAAHSFSLAAPLQSLSRCEESGRSEAKRSGAPGPGICTTQQDLNRPAGRQAGRQGRSSMELWGLRADRDLLPNNHCFIYLSHPWAFYSPTWRLQPAGCLWLHTSSSSANKVRHATTHMTQSAQRFGFYHLFNLLRQLQVSCDRNKQKKSQCRPHFCIFVMMRNLLLCLISRTEPAVRNALRVFGNI